MPTEPLTPDRRLSLASSNPMACQKRASNVVEYAKHMEQPFDIICVQNPPRDVKFVDWFDDRKEFTEDDHPLANTRASTPALRKKMRVAYFVHRSIPTTDWRVTTDDYITLI